MRILITGLVAFVIWSFISAWLYNDKLLPVMKRHVPVVTIPENQTTEADSVMKLKASLPGALMIYFEFNEAEFKADPQTDKRVAGLKVWLEKYPGAKLSVTGHTDLVGTSEFNMELGLRRAEIISRYLKGQGIPAGRIIKESMGETSPAGDYLTAEGRAKNRRAEITVKL